MEGSAPPLNQMVIEHLDGLMIATLSAILFKAVSECLIRDKRKP